jgi:6-phosphogluconolactonase
VNDFDVEVLSDERALAARAAELVGQHLGEAVADRGRATFAVSGGSTPAAFLARLAEEPLPWEAIHVFQVDERVAPPGDPERNLTGLQAALLDRVPIPPGNVHPMPVNDPDLDVAAAGYADELRKVAGPEGRLDVVHLGIGDDGHTASWPPGDPVVDAADDVAVVGPFNGRLRMTLTPPAVNRAGFIVWHVAGSGKAPAVRGRVDGDPALPASRVRRSDAVLLIDDAAAADLA